MIDDKRSTYVKLLFLKNKKMMRFQFPFPKNIPVPEIPFLIWNEYLPNTEFCLIKYYAPTRSCQQVLNWMLRARLLKLWKFSFYFADDRNILVVKTNYLTSMLQNFYTKDKLRKIHKKYDKKYTKYVKRECEKLPKIMKNIIITRQITYLQQIMPL